MKSDLKLKSNLSTNYNLIAVRSQIEDYQFAYLLNKSPLFFLHRLEKDISFIIKNRPIYFSVFKYSNDVFQRSSFLIKNKSIYNSQPNKDGLFSDKSISNSAFLIPELKEFDYFIKLVGIWKNQEFAELKEVLNKINTIETETSINIKKIKSINNLII